MSRFGSKSSFPHGHTQADPFPQSDGQRRGPPFTIRQPFSGIPCGMADQRMYTLHEIADFRGEFHAIADKLETVKLQLDQLAQKIPTRRERARNALRIIFCTAVLTTLAILCFAEYWHWYL